MLLASAMGFIKLLALAYTLPANEYGQYVAHFGIATFLSLLLSFGLTEKTIKDYPRRWVSGHRVGMLSDALRVGRILSFRFFLIAIVGILISYYDLISFSPVEVVWTTGLGLCTVALALIGSLYRATGSQKALQYFTCWRSMLVLGIALPTGWLMGWQGALGGDIVGNLLSVGLAIWQLPQLYKNEIHDESIEQMASPTDIGHYQIYLANLVVAPQSMLDRGWVNRAIGPALAGSYGVVMLIPQVVQLLGNVVVQHVGPLIIKLVYLKSNDLNRQSSIRLNALFLILFSFVLTISALCAKRITYLNYLFEKYVISDISLIIVFVIACGQIYGLIEFHLIARNRERDVLLASLASCFIFLVSFASATLAHVGIEWFLAGAGAARWAQVWFLSRAYLRHA